MQRNWIGRSEGARVKFALEGDASTPIEVFTTRIDTIYGATFVLLGPEHPLVQTLAGRSQRSATASASRCRPSACRTAPPASAARSRSRASTPASRAINPFTKEPVPVWVANFVLGDYGTGAIMAVPAHDERDFEFATQVRPADSAGRRIARRWRGRSPRAAAADVRATGRSSTPANSPACAPEEAQKRMIAAAKARGIGEGTVQYRLKDWGISRQRYWGTPIPMIVLPDATASFRCPTISCRWSCRRSRSSPAAAIRRWRRCPSS